MSRRNSSGALRVPVFLGRPVVVKDGAGGEAITWQEFATWARIDAAGGREWATAAIVKDTVDCRITVRVIPGWIPEARWRVREKESGRLYDLVTVMLAPQFGNAECLARTAQGNTDAR